jgi:hypothetical protein
MAHVMQLRVCCLPPPPPLPGYSVRTAARTQDGARILSSQAGPSARQLTLLPPPRCADEIWHTTTGTTIKIQDILISVYLFTGEWAPASAVLSHAGAGTAPPLAAASVRQVTQCVLGASVTVLLCGAQWRSPTISPAQRQQG